jgi:AcrR family transcriptional regulator
MPDVQQESTPLRQTIRHTGRLSQVERSDRTRRRLLHAAVELLAERGYERASLAAIGERAGYSRGIVTTCFGSKADLLASVVEDMLGRWGHRSLRPAVGKSVGSDALCAAIDAVREQARNHPVELKAFFLLLFEALGPLPEMRPRFAEVHRLQREGLTRWIQAGIDAGRVRKDVDAEAQAGLFLSVFRGAMYQWLLDPESIDLDRLLDEQKRNVQAVLRPR